VAIVCVKCGKPVATCHTICGVEADNLRAQLLRHIAARKQAAKYCIMHFIAAVLLGILSVCIGWVIPSWPALPGVCLGACLVSIVAGCDMFVLQAMPAKPIEKGS
jgi:hypothetical protein